jgi:hypothetical protein
MTNRTFGCVVTSFGVGIASMAAAAHGDILPVVIGFIGAGVTFLGLMTLTRKRP